MYAAQMAYQQTIMAMSQAGGSQMGDAPDGRNSPSGSVRAASPFGYGGYGMMPNPMSMYGGFPQFMPGMPMPMGSGAPSMQGQMGWQSPSPTGGHLPGQQPHGDSHPSSERDDRQAS